MVATTSVLVALVAIGAALLVHVQNHLAPLDIYAPLQSAGANASAERHFAESYYHARAQFRAHAQAAGATLVTRALDDFAHLDLTIDIAVVSGAKDRVLLHMSGTHGVEGFAGSAIQSALLERAASARDTAATTAPPTVIFVHALNPYGFSQLRRFNEHNVDLNRNWLTPEQFAAFAANDPNANGYMDLFDVLNPSSVGGAFDSFWAKSAYHIATKGFASVKRAIVSGTYHFADALYFGGTEMQQSLVLLRAFLREHFDLDAVRTFGMIDVHTGLGPAGFDTLLVGTPRDMDDASKIFGEYERRMKSVAPVRGSATNGVAEGYESTAGFVIDGVAELLPARAQACSVLLAQEFGTVPGVFIVKAAVEENFAYHHAPPSARLPYAEKLRDVFYLHRSASWKTAVVERGIAVFDQVHTHVASCE